MANTKVKITYVNSTPPTVTVDPDPAQVKVTGRATWEIVQLPSGYTYKLDFSVQSSTKGPFPKQPDDPNNPSRGVYVGTNGTNVTMVNDQAAGTSWKYDVIIYNGSTVVVELDPGIEIIEV